MEDNGSDMKVEELLALLSVSSTQHNVEDSRLSRLL
jgi:hypothetical protein